jgi:hypothetical protein
MPRAPESPPLSDAPVAAAWQPLVTAALLAGAIVALYFGQGILIPLALAALLSFALAPLVERQRGALPPEQLERIKATVRSLVDDLADQEDADPRPGRATAETTAALAPAGNAAPTSPVIPGEAPPPEELPPAWRGERAVLCLAGRGPLDEAASSMLAQLLREHGLGARALPHEAASRTGILELDVAGVAMVCISYLDVSGNPAHLRYLLRRLRQKLPRAHLLVGLWPAEEAVLTDASLRAEIGAGFYVTSLRGAVEACLRAAREQAGKAAAEGGRRVERAEGMIHALG